MAVFDTADGELVSLSSCIFLAFLIIVFVWDLFRICRSAFAPEFATGCYYSISPKATCSPYVSTFSLQSLQRSLGSFRPVFILELVFRWTLNGTFTASGNNWENSNVRSWLSLTLLLARPGTISFSYMVDGELNYDGMRFYIDNVAVWPKVISVQSDWATYTSVRLSIARVSLLSLLIAWGSFAS